MYNCVRKSVTLIRINLSYPISQSWRDRFWAEFAINFCQKNNRFHTDLVIPDDVGKLLLEIWQNLWTSWYCI